jgi:hypothetical protein
MPQHHLSCGRLGIATWQLDLQPPMAEWTRLAEAMKDLVS